MLKLIFRQGRYYIQDQESKKVWWYSYEMETLAEMVMDTLQSAWNRDPLEKARDLVVNFVIEAADLETVVLKSEF